MAVQNELDAGGEAALAVSIQNHISRMWRAAEQSVGDVRSFYHDDGEFCIEGHVYTKGHDELRKIGVSRAQIGGGLARHSRHLMSNYDFDFGGYAQAGRVEVFAVMLHFGGSGETPLPLEPPIGLYDVRAVVARQPGGGWLIGSWRMTPIFLGKDHPMLTGAWRMP